MPESNSLDEDVVYKVNNKNHGKSRLTKFQIKLAIANFLDHPKGNFQNFYHFIIYILGLVSFVMNLLKGIPELGTLTVFIIFMVLECFLVIEYIIEFVLRLWLADLNEKNRKYYRLYYLLTPPMILDSMILITSIPLVICFFLGFRSDFIVVSMLIFCQILRIFRFERYYRTFTLMYRVMYNHRHELITGYSCGLFFILLTAFILFLCEKASALNELNSVADSIYFSTITYLTIGFGDIVPTATVSKIFICFLTFIGIAFTSVPSGIIGSGFALQAAHRAKKKSKKSSIPPSRILLQRACRNYLYQNNCNSIAEYDFERVLRNNKNTSFILNYEKNMIKDDSYNDSSIKDNSNRFLATTTFTNTGNHALSRSILDTIRAFRNKHVNINNDVNIIKLKPIVRISCQFIRYLQFRTFLRKFISYKSPLSLGDTVEDIRSEQQKITYQLEQLTESIKILKTNFICLSNASFTGNQSHKDSESIKQMNDRMKRIEDTLNIVLSKFQNDNKV